MATAAQDMFQAATELMEAVEQLRAEPVIQGTWVDMFLRSLIASAAWTRMRHARKAWERTA